MSRLNTFLRGVRVVDLSRYLPGPLATLLLADLGADVIKVEPPAGEGLRALGLRLPDGRSAWHEAVNAGKRLATLGLREPADRATLRELIDEADVLLESFRPGVMRKLGLDLAELRARNPRLVCVSLSGYGQFGPLRDAAGHDNNYLGQAGLLASVGPAGDVPTLIEPPLADCLGSMFALSSVLGALLARERDGRGCAIDIALADVAMPLQVFGLSELGLGTAAPRRAERLLNGGWACYGIYRTKDGREMALGAIEEKFWSRFCRAAGQPDWIARQDDPLPQRALQQEVASFFAGLTLAELRRRFDGVDCCLSAVLTLEESVASTYAASRGVLRKAEGGPGMDALFPAIVDGQAPEARERLKTWRRKSPPVDAG
jgi:crotonobetainyl-CoA:carnitine CoA-transferase CaiB-like acyl-CoA transferase